MNSFPKKHTAKNSLNLLKYGFLGLLSIYGCVCLAMYAIQEKLIFPAKPIEANTNLNFPFWQKIEEVYVPVKGARLHALHFIQDHPKGVVVYFHGNGGELDSWGYSAQTFVKLGYAVFMADYRSYGKSTGTITNERDLHDDAEAVYQYVLRSYSEQDIVLYGRSLGTGFAARLAANHAPKVLILETPYYSFKDLLSSMYPMLPTFLLKYQIRTDEVMPTVKCPVYLFHGTQDNVVPYDSSQRLLALSPNAFHLITIPGGNHGNLAQFQDYQDAIVEILK